MKPTTIDLNAYARELRHQLELLDEVGYILAGMKRHCDAAARWADTLPMGAEEYAEVSADLMNMAAGITGTDIWFALQDCIQGDGGDSGEDPVLELSDVKITPLK